MCLLTMACTISLWPVRVGFDFPHTFSVLWMLSTISSHSVLTFVLFPIQAPSDLMVSPLLAILIQLWKGDWSSWFIFQVTLTCSLYALDLIGIISVFSMLNLAPDA